MKNKDLHICLYQFSPIWLEADKNIQIIENQEFEKDTQVLVLPEMFATGFCMEPKKAAQKADGSIVLFMQRFSKEKNIAICGSVAIEENGKYYNRFYFFDKGIKLAQYDKRHLFSYSGEEKVYTAGTEQVFFQFEGWKFCPQICYDLRFPVWSRNRNNYDILLNVANWPSQRMSIWNHLIPARSIENMCYAIACNRVGIDGNNLEYTGDSQVCFPSTEKIPFQQSGEKMYFCLDYQKLEVYKKQYPFLKDADHFTINP